MIRKSKKESERKKMNIAVLTKIIIKLYSYQVMSTKYKNMPEK